LRINGETRNIGAGEIVLVEDTTGKGHITKSSGGIPRLSRRFVHIKHSMINREFGYPSVRGLAKAGFDKNPCCGLCRSAVPLADESNYQACRRMRSITPTATP